MEHPLTPGASITLTDTVRLETKKRSALAIGGYPTFKYNAAKGGGVAKVLGVELGVAHVRFDPDSVKIPSLTWKTGRFLGAPLMPFLRIDIVPSKLEGFIELATGKIELQLSADFRFSAAGFYKVVLHVDTNLTTEHARSEHHDKTGSRLDPQGNSILVGVGDVALTKSGLMNKVLRLPTDVLGLMKSRFYICQSSLPGSDSTEESRP